MANVKSYSQWLNEKRRKLRLAHRHEYEERVTDKNFDEWTADLYQAYVQGEYALSNHQCG